MVVAPNILGQIKGKSLSANSALGGQPALQISPKSLQSVDVTPAAVAELSLAVLNHPVHITLGRDPCITLPGVGANHRSRLNPPANKGHKRFCLHIRHHLGPDGAAPAENAEDRCLGRTPAPFGSPAANTFSLVLPGVAQIGLVHLHGLPENVGNFAHHRHSDHRKGPQYALALKAGFPGNGLGAKTPCKPPQQLTPLPGCKTKRQGAGFPFIMTTGATTLFSPDNPVFCTITSRTTQTFCHPATLSC